METANKEPVANELSPPQSGTESNRKFIKNFAHFIQNFIQRASAAPNKIAALVFILYFAAGLFVFPDYGISTDEPTERQTAAVNALYVVRTITGNQDITLGGEYPDLMQHDLMSHDDRAYGVALQLIPLSIEYLLDSVLGFDISMRDAYLMRHLFTFINHYTAGIFFYLILRRRFGSAYIPLIGALFFILSPRFFGESFYNIKDTLFISWIIISSYFALRWLEGKKLRYLLMGSAAIAIATNTRILGLAVLLLTCAFSIIADGAGFRRKEDGGSAIRRLLRLLWEPTKLILLTYAFYIIITPFLWAAPLRNTVEIFDLFLHYSGWVGTHFYLGEMISSSVPWHYIPVWMSITLPLLYIATFLVGAVAVCAGAVSWIYRKIKPAALDAGVPRADIIRPYDGAPSGLHMYDLFFFAMFFCTLLGFILFKINMYSGWRHGYGIYPSFLYISVLGLERAASFFEGKRAVLRKAFSLAVALCLAYQLGWIILNHPYQYVYFNAIGRQVAEANFALDYWHVSHYDLVKYALEDAGNSEIALLGHSYATGAFLSDDEKELVSYTRNPDDADYCDYVIVATREPAAPPAGFVLIKEIRSGGLVISSLYRQIEP